MDEAEEIVPLEVLLKEACKIYKEEFGVTCKCKAPNVAAFAPGRVNLIGEHTDYNKGFVLPMGLPMVTVVVGSKSNTQTCVVVTGEKETADKPLKVEFPIPSVEGCKPGKPRWANYVKGIVQNFKGDVPGFIAVVHSNVPLGGGLSSSASLEVAMYTFLEALTGNIAGTLEKVLLCQKAEHEFAGVPCGLMDQFIAVNAKKGHALLMDCKSNEGKHVPFADPNLCVIIANSNVKHALAQSKYPERRKECEAAAVALNKESLRDATLDDLEKAKESLKGDQYKRAKHVITEIARAQEAAKALESNQMETFGKLMYDSHQSLRDDFEVSCQELDDLVDGARSVPGVLGSRMTGGGFGGCTVTLAPKSLAKEVIHAMKKQMKGEPTFYIVDASAGAQVLKLVEK